MRAAQTFTAVNSGLLTSAQLHIGKSDAPYEHPVTVQVTDVDTSGAPGQVLATATIPSSEIPLDQARSNEPLTTVNFSNPAFVAAGHKYGLVADSAELTNEYFWNTSGANSFGGVDYPGGEFWYDIYIAMPEGPQHTGGWVIFSDALYEMDLGFATYLSPLPFSGFFAPVDSYPTRNVVHQPAGTANQLLRFSLGRDEGLDIFANGYPSSTRVACPSESPADVVEDTAPAEASNLNYTGNGQYTYSWQTEKAWKGTCRELNLRLKDGTDHKVLFQFTK